MWYLFIDFETSSSVHLPTVGAYNYINHASTDIACTSFWLTRNPLAKFSEDQVITSFGAAGTTVELAEALSWNVEEDITMRDIVLVAHNILFETLCIRRFFPWLLQRVIKYVDTQSFCAINAIRLSLGNAVMDLGLGQDKFVDGKMIMHKLNNPNNPLTINNLTEDELALLEKYSAVDVVLTVKLYQKLWSCLTDHEHKIWEITFKANLRGVPLDMNLVSNAIDMISIYKDYSTEKLKDIVPAEFGIETLNQSIKIAKYLGLKSAASEELEKHLAKETDPKKREFIELRREAGKTAYKKFIAAADKVSDTELIDIDDTKYYYGMLKDNILYHGANTGRFTSYDVQLQNLISSKKDEADQLINSIRQGEFDVSKIPTILNKCIRGMFIPIPGQDLIVADYGQIEARILCWLTGEEDLVEKFRKGQPIYEEMAAKIFRIPVSDVKPEQRKYGKMTVLACGYGMGASRFSLQNRIDLDLADLCVKTFRSSRPILTKFWKGIENKAIESSVTPGFLSFGKLGFHCSVKEDSTELPSGRVIRHHDVKMILPSGRPIYYNKLHLADYDELCELFPMLAIKNMLPKQSLVYKSRERSDYVWDKIWGGDFTNHVCQGTSRDLLCAAMVELDQHYQYTLLFTVHDELVYSAIRDRYTKDQFVKIIHDSAPKWAEGLPLAFSCGVHDRYYKD